MKTYQAGGMIQARPEVIWALLTDAEIYTACDPSCERLEGRIQSDALLSLQSALESQLIQYQVKSFKPQHKMVWAGGMPLGLLRRERTFVLRASENSQTAVLIQEIVSGPLLRFFSHSIPDLSETFRELIHNLNLRALQQPVFSSEL